MSEMSEALNVLFQTITGEAGMTQPEEVAVIEEPKTELRGEESEGEALQKRTVLLRLKISSFGTKVGVDTRKLVDTDEKKAAAGKSLTSHKLILKSNRLDKISSLDGDFRRWIVGQALTVGFLKGGMYCVPAVRSTRIEEEIEKYERRRAQLVDDFIREEYITGRAQAEARVRLEPLGLYDERDYPRAGAIEAAYKVETKFMQLEAPTVLKDIDAGLLAKELEKEKAFWREAAYDVKAALRSQMQELLAHLVDRLTPGEDGKRRSSGTHCSTT